ncbi:MAG: hypothetical protein QNL62_12370 [Gammaproteobacteria bacterium]|nr:hypothetical protein [Gammaproteobacteria bacterium]
MSAILQDSIVSHLGIDDASNRSGNRNEAGPHGRQTKSGSAQDQSSSTINISYHAELRLRAYQEQRMLQMNQSLAEPEQSTISLMNAFAGLKSPQTQPDMSNTTHNEHSNISQPQQTNNGFTQHIAVMLSEVEDNIVQSNEPGYQHLVNVLNNHIDSVVDQQQLQEIMRKEQFFLTRRKPFMDSSDFQSYSQVLGQFANIVERQKFSI